MTWPACFPDIIHARPKESSCNPFVLFDDVPRIVGVVGTDISFRSTEIRQFLSHQELAFREFLMVGKHSSFEVVVTHHIGYSRELLVMTILASNAHLPSWFQLMDEVLQHLCPCYTFARSIPCLLQFVAFAPCHHAWVVSVANNHIAQVGFPPLVKVFSIIARLPFVESLVDDDKSHFVAEVEKFGSRLIMTATNGIHAIFLADFQASLHGAIGECRTQ